MTVLRQEASALLATMPEEHLLALIQYMRDMLKTPQKEADKANDKANIDIMQYAGSAGKLFGSVESADDYIKEMRENERF